MKRAILCLILTLLLTVTASAAGVDALYVTCEVRSDGSAEYSVAVSAQFESVEKTFTIPLAGEGISKVSASGDWTHQSDGGWDRVELRSGDGFIGRQTFVVTYRTAAAEADGTMDLPLVGSRWEMDVAEFSFDVTMPTPLEKTPALISGYSGEMLGIVDLTATGFTGVIAEGLMAHESLRVELTLPEDYFGHARLRSFLGLDWGLIFLGLVIAASGVYWLRTLRSRRPVVQSRVLPPEGWTPAEVPTILDGSSPNMRSLLGVWGQLGYLYVDHAGGELVLGQRMSMGSERPAHERAMFEAMFQGRREFWLPDRRYYQAESRAGHSMARLWRGKLFDHRGGNPRILRLLAALAAGIASAGAVASLLPAGVGWTLLAAMAFVPGVVLGVLGQLAVSQLRRRPAPDRNLLPGVGALLLLALMGAARILYALPALGLQLFVGWQLAYGGRRSAAGVEALGDLLSLRRFLRHASPKRLHQVLKRDPGWLQTVLPYAQQLGLSDRLGRVLGSTRVEEPAWLRTDEPLLTASACCGAYARFLAAVEPKK